MGASHLVSGGVDRALRSLTRSLAWSLTVSLAWSLTVSLGSTDAARSLGLTASAVPMAAGVTTARAGEEMSLRRAARRQDTEAGGQGGVSHIESAHTDLCSPSSSVTAASAGGERIELKRSERRPRPRNDSRNDFRAR